MYKLETEKSWKRTVWNGKSGDLRRNYELSWNGSVLVCSCLGWKFSKLPNAQRTCIHVRYHYPDYEPAARNPLVKVDMPGIPLFSSFNPETHSKNVTDFWWSEKHDGIRAIWTGKSLITRGGHLINTPSGFEDLPPNIQLDGELVADTFDDMLMAFQGGPDSIVWERVHYKVFDSPQWPDVPFSERYQRLLETEEDGKWNFRVIRQHRVKSFEQIQFRLKQMTDKGKEGIVLRHPDALYRKGRNAKMALKWKLVSTGQCDIIEPGDHDNSYLVRVHSPRESRGKTIQLNLEPHDASKARVGLRAYFTYRGFTGSGKPKFARFESLCDSE